MKKDYEELKKDMTKQKLKKKDISTYEGDCYLGIDAGSTTTKLVLIDKDGNLLYFYMEAMKVIH